MIAISTKELRKNFAKVVKALSDDKVFLLIHNSVIVAEIKKPTMIKTFEEATEEEIEQSAAQDIAQDDDYLSPKEINYYLSLK